MSEHSNRQWKLRARPVGEVKREDFELVRSPVAEPGPGQVVVRVQYLSLDPAMRGWMNEGRSYVPPVALGEVMRALGVGEVVASNDPSLPVGAAVTGVTGVQDYFVAGARGLTRIDPQLAPLPRWLGALGMTGMTAYFGLLEIGRPQPGQTVVVSGAAGAVGALVGQIARVVGSRAVGIAGGPDKCRYLTAELGFDAAIDYKHEDVRKALQQHCPQGVDVYFDNVGGDILDAVLGQLARRARIIICGAISQYNQVGGPSGPKNYLALLVHRARMEGFVVFDYAPRYPEAVARIAGWLAEGSVKAREDVVEGLETFPEALARLFRGENFGKLVLKV
jgi:NADPH-dependent curcumin reductase CurA